MFAGLYGLLSSAKVSFVHYEIKFSQEDVEQASAYEKQERVTITSLVTKFRGYRRVKSLTPPTK